MAVGAEKEGENRSRKYNKPRANVTDRRARQTGQYVVSSSTGRVWWDTIRVRLSVSGERETLLLDVDHQCNCGLERKQQPRSRDRLDWGGLDSWHAVTNSNHNHASQVHQNTALQARV